jgi:hypothetical protein
MTDPVAVDITGSLFQVPEGLTDGMYQKIPYPQITDFTTGSVTGTGVFDKMMASLNAQLADQFEQGRITGSEYTKAYIELAQIAMTTALQYALGDDNSYWQAQQAQIAAITARIEMEKARYEYEAAQFNVISMLPAQLAMLNSQKSLVDVQTSSASYTLANILPEQKTATHEQAEVQHAQTSDVRLDGTTTVTGLVGKQKALYSQQIISYQRDAEVKAAKLFSDAWITQKTMDSGLLAPVGFTNNSVDEVLTVIMANNAFGTPAP